MTTDQVCFDAANIGFAAYYEIPRDVYLKLQALADLMKKSPGSEEFATKLLSLLGQVECVLKD